MKISGQNTIAKNIFHLFYSTALSSGLNALALIVLASYLHSYHYGLFSVSLALTMIMGFFTDAGLSEIALREGSKKEANLAVIIISYIKIRLLLLVATFLFGFIIIHFLHMGQGELLRTSHFLSVPMVIGIALQSIGTTFFQMTEKMQYIGLIRMMSALLLVGMTSLGMLFSAEPLVMCVLYGSSYLLAGIFALCLVMNQVKLKMRLPFHKGMMEHFGFFTLSGLLFMVLPQLGPIVLEKTLSLKQVGLFAVAYRIPQALQQVPFIVAGAYRPVMFRHYHQQNLDKHTEENMMLLKTMSMFGMIMTIPFYYCSDMVITWLFGSEWLFASEPLKILSIMLTLQAMNIALADGLTTRGLQKFRTLVQFITVVLAVLFYSLLSFKSGVVGAAYAGLLIEGLALAGFWIFLPGRWRMAHKVIVPYLIYFFAGLWILNVLLHSKPYLAATVHILLLACMVFLDRDLYRSLTKRLEKSPIKSKTRRKRGIENGL
ncbi:Membrane protein involved in the export of O-antigen and teichoic acid [Fictibacillus solisalsi]|uniref:Membrane protein involved in the export of O-antigen and teichoic acid n=1 Tax=Fictibacillus solisalsi TaxID=459525 RepID=A0A1G9YGX8_9BACL|nr:oligosaccharide flippase family protein [Fictibacillus solisalsi]SDN07775.1 Membrane protein involved in the export of O-antigen and teichoic acid [Fictibacillus solisalsi]